MSVMLESTLRGYLYDWFASVLPALWVGTGGTRPAGKTEFVWHMENNARPATPVLEGRMSADSRIGRDTVANSVSGATGHVGEQTITGDREFMVYLHWFGPGALDGLKTIRNATNDPLQLQSIQSKGIAIVDCLPIIDAHIYLDTMTEDGAMMDMRFRYYETFITIPGLIEHANITGEIDDVPLPNTITI